MRALLITTAVVAAVVVGCSSPTSRYPDAHDGAPEKTISAADVVDAVPRPDPILRAGNKSPYSVNGETYEILDDYTGYRAQGVASWYGTKFHGHKTSNGEIFDLYRATAAHKTLPIPCYARVTNLENGRSVVVRINDRGPFHSERLIDLSYGAAIRLGYMERGTARVEVQVIDVPGVDDRRDSESGNYRYLQLGAFGSQASAVHLQEEVQQLVAAPVFISPVQSGSSLLYRVRIGPVASGAQLVTVQRHLESSGYGSGQLLP